MKNRLEIIVDIAGKCLFAWFIYETYKYIFGGYLTYEIKMVKSLFNNGFTFVAFYSLVKIPVATFGAIILPFFLFRGLTFGLILGLLYWVMGNITNPFWLFLPYQIQVSPEGNATNFLISLNIIWSLFAVLVILLFYLQRRKQHKCNNIKHIPKRSS